MDAVIATVTAFFGPGLPLYLVLAAVVVGVFAIVSTFTPTSADNAVANVLVKAIHVLGANWGKAKNASDTMDAIIAAGETAKAEQPPAPPAS